MKRNTRIVVSIVGIIIVSLMLLGLTYGYFITQISGNTNEKSVEVVTGNMSIIYTDLSSEVEEIITPGFQTVKTFTIENNGNVPANYSIYLVDVINNFTRTQDITYILYRLDNEYTETVTIDTNFSDWTVVADGTFPTTSTSIKSETIPNKQEGDTSNPIYTYALLITYENAAENQNVDQGKTFSAKINIRGSENDTNPYSEGTLAYTLYSDSRVKKNPTAPQFTGVATTEEGLYSAEDDYGTSWYYRGAQPNNYVSFAGFTWRVVRINGDGSIRLILDGTLDKTCVEYNTDNTCKTYAQSTIFPFNFNNNDNAYVGYMYGFTGGVTNKCITKNTDTGEYTVNSSSSYTTKTTCENAGGRWAGTAYETTHINVNSNATKIEIDTFYEKYIENAASNYYYEKYLADTMFCGDKSLANDEIGSSNTALGYAKNKTYYSASERLHYSSGITSITIAEPTLKCAENETYTYSRYTVEEQNINNVKTNGDLKHPIALLSADELVMAGAFKSMENRSYYLYDAYENGLSQNYWWALTPYSFTDTYAVEYLSSSVNNSLSNGYVSNQPVGIRPVINLKKEILFDGGTGISDDPYKVTLETVKFSFENEEEYEVVKGTTFAQFIEESNNTKFKLESDNSVSYTNSTGGINKHCFSSLTDTFATGDTVIENSKYYCHLYF